METKGVFMHAKDNTEAERINDWSCYGDPKSAGYRGYDYSLLGIKFKTYPHLTGFWCDRGTEALHFICESLI